MRAAGKMRERLTLQAKSVTRNSIGEEVVTWVDQVTVWAEPVTLTGREFFAAAQMQFSADAAFLIDYRSDVTPDWRVLWRGVAYDIRSALPSDATRRQLKLLCTTGIHDGR